MKKFLPHILILVVLVGVFSPSYALAQWSPIPQWMSNPASLVNDLLLLLSNAFLTFLSWFAGFAGAILDYVLDFTILNMKINIFGDGTATNPGLSGINISWKIIKDLMNIAFIFILLYESIKIIIGQGNVEQVKRFVLGIVLASLLINFSLFFTKVLIDASNIVTIGVYQSILSTPVTPPQPGQTPTRNSIATILLSKLRLQSIYNTANPALADAGTSLIFLIGSSIIFLVFTFVVLAITANFIIRYVAFIILLVLSPIAYMGIALSGVKKYQDQWWDAFRSQLIFAPVFMIMLMIVIQLISSPGFVSQANFGDMFTGTNINPNNPNGATYTPASAVLGNTSASGLVLNFTVVIGLLIATLTVSKGISKKGSSHIGDATSKLTGYAGGMFMGGAGRLGRGTIGRWGNNTANDEDLKDRAAKGDMRARLKLSAANKLATSSFDARATDTFGALAKAGGVGGDFGKVDPKKTNFRAITEQRAKDEAEKVKQYYKVSDDANDEAKRKDKAAKEAEDKLNSNTFVNEENRKWQETDEGKASLEKEKELDNAIKIKSENDKKIEENAKKLKELQKQLDWTESQEEKNRLQSEIDSIKNDDTRRKSEVDNLNKAIEDRKKIYEEAKAKRDQFKSTERLALEQVAKFGTNNESELKQRYKDRVNEYANRIENSGAIYRYGSTIAKMTGATILGGSLGGLHGAIAGAGYVLSQKEQTNNSADRRVIARKIRGVAGEKSKKEKAEEAAREYMEEQKKKEEEEKNNSNTDDKPKDDAATKTT